ncbi:MAG: hypothetical protein KIS76_02380 [Pyrinomonadaceae bacterium]|nr:hypothetical protein [Pyrinomonadaceae bacterium]
MRAVITGDIINSRSSSDWLDSLKRELERLGSRPADWEIYRGDAFQIFINDAADALANAILIRAAMKAENGMDVRMAIGIGDVDHRAANVLESNGTAFVNSGQKFELLKKERQNLAVKSPSDIFDRDINLILKLASIAIDGWTVSSAQAVHAALIAPDISQQQIGEQLGIKQNAVSGRLKRAFFDEIKDVIGIYRIKILELI